jgi:elongation factor Ts
LQVAAANPLYLTENDIPQEALDREAKIAEARAKEEGKPDNIVPKIVEGYLKKYKGETVLMNQAYIRDGDLTIEDLINDQVVKLGEKIIVRRFVRWELGAQSAEDVDSEEEAE